MSGSSVLEPQTPLLETENEAVHGYVDYKGSPGGWRSASFMLAGGSLERFAYYGVESNLISYLTGPIGESVATAAANVNTWIGVVSLVPVLGAYLADSFLGRHRSIIFTSLLYILGLGLLSLSAIIIPTSASSSTYQGMNKKSDPDTGNQVLFFVSLYLIALAQGYKPCVQAFGADQFIEKDQEKGKAKSSFFNWWICGICIGSIAAHLILHYIQDNINWAIGFGIPCLAMVLGLILFLLGNRTYFFAVKRGDEESYHGRINWGREEVDDALHNGPLASSSQGQCKEYLLLKTPQRSQGYRLLKDILPAADDFSTDNIGHSSKRKERKNVITLLPVWITCLTYTIAYAQASTIFLKQATTLDRSIGTNFNIPAATLKTFIPLTVMFCIPIYDKIFVPVARAITKYPTGITMLQRIGAGMGISVITLVVAALVEMKRLKTAEDYGLVDIPNATLPMSFWWLVPQYILFGFADVFIQVGMQEFFYDQVPIELRSVGLSFHFGALGIGNFLSSFLVSMIDKATSQSGRVSWFSDNLNHAHIDYFYWLLAGIGAVGLIIFVYISRFYSYVGQNDD
ncbi:protein NRT1/ PTR FAMILY 5.10-like [Coffea eugenioides]|uniref:Protein NRT1/ PTR FAMILY 5.10-like n=1 Tax=Coffea arabica TaxID=13443 RepID=A0A6P6UME2_COFAR|nr:protein NRT1/ PTR FAMILY 5.10-like [Coffea arabica]XP_027150173.1 protein NRT1/ PTR FAMILY 5.10-like [Coffea eugenioides]